MERELASTTATGYGGAGRPGHGPILEVDGRTLAEIPAAEKNTISHRAVALGALAQALSG